MLATAGRAPTGPGWAWEVKWDGVRLIAACEAGRLTLVTRNGNDVTHRYPELAGLCEAVGRDAVLDGEVVAFDDAGRPSFQVLQRRMHVDDRHEIPRLAAATPVALMLFDLLSVDGDSLLELPYLERRERLSELGLAGAAWQTPPHELGDGHAIQELSRARGLEGVLAKRVDSTYQPGQRSRDWVKVKHFRTQELIVGGWLPGEGSRQDTFGALLLAHWETAPDGTRRFRYAGRAGTGFRQSDLEGLLRALRSIERTESPFDAGPVPRGARFVDPVIVVQVRFGEWTDTGIIRHPVFLGVRSDVDPDDVVRES
jgi:bifunctional non-homologous end joining protein LigD